LKIRLLRDPQYLVIPAWIASVLLHRAVVPFPPWASRAGAAALFVLLLTYVLGMLLETCSALLRPRAPAALAHRAARIAFLAGGILVFALHGRPDELGSLWFLFLITGRLGATSFAPDHRSSI
jgi:hypothetical protein